MITADEVTIGPGGQIKRILGGQAKGCSHPEPELGSIVNRLDPVEIGHECQGSTIVINSF